MRLMVHLNDWATEGINGRTIVDGVPCTSNILICWPSRSTLKVKWVRVSSKGVLWLLEDR